MTILQRGPQVLKEMDGDVATALADAFARRGVPVLFGTKLERFEKTDAGKKRVFFEHEGEQKSLEAEEIIYALGRGPATDKLGIDRAGIATMHGRLSVNAHQQTSVPHIFAAGDAAGPHEIVHIAIQQGELAARNAARFLKNGAQNKQEALEQIDYRLKLFVVFSEPQVAAVGFTESELMTAGAALLRGALRLRRSWQSDGARRDGRFCEIDRRVRQLRAFSARRQSARRPAS